jgi:hypothetical protein
MTPHDDEVEQEQKTICGSKGSSFGSDDNIMAKRTAPGNDSTFTDLTKTVRHIFFPRHAITVLY